MAVTVARASQATVSFATPQEIIISQADDSILCYGKDGTTNRVLKTDSGGELQVDVLTSGLPTGAATEASLAKLTITQGTAIGSNTMAMAGAQVKVSGNSAYSDNEIRPLNQSGTGRLYVDNNFQYSVPYVLPGSGTDVYTAAGNGVAVTGNAVSTYYAIQVVSTGGPATAWDMRLEASLDGVNFTQIIAHTQVDLDTTVKWSGPNHYPAATFRSRCASLTLGTATDITVYIYGV